MAGPVLLVANGSRRMLDPRAIWSQAQSILAWAPAWLVGILILVAAAAAAVLAHLVLIGIVRRIAAGRRFFLGALVGPTGAATRPGSVYFDLRCALQVGPF